MTAATMDDEVFREFRKFGFSEEIAAIMAKIASRRDDEFVTRADREAEREAERTAREAEREAARDAARAVREAERAADREAFAAKGDVTVLQTEMTDVKAAIVRIDKSIERIDATLASMQEMLARLDEQMKASRRESKIFVIPLLFATLGALIALLSKGTLWGVAP